MKKRKMLVSVLAICVLVIVLIAGRLIPSKSRTTADFVHGSAETPDGTTIIVTIFASDPTYSWDMSSSDDKKTIANINDYLGIAGDYIESVVSSYGKDANFISDFEKDSDLAYYTNVDVNMEGDSGLDEAIWSYISSNIDVDGLMSKYHADNVVFFTAMNTDKNSKAVTCTRNWYDGMPYPYEIVYLYNVDYQEINPPAVYAHEIFHAFGAPDLYSTDEEFGIDDADMTYFQENIPNDIMLTCSDLDSGNYLYDRVSNDTTELTAYYIGLTDTSAIASKLGLTGNQHLSK